MTTSYSSRMCYVKYMLIVKTKIHFVLSCDDGIYFFVNSTMFFFYVE